MDKPANILTARICDRFGNRVRISVRSAVPVDTAALAREIEVSATRLMDLVRKPPSTTHVTSNT
jgi:hypothetical protein